MSKYRGRVSKRSKSSGGNSRWLFNHAINVAEAIKTKDSTTLESYTKTRQLSRILPESVTKLPPVVVPGSLIEKGIK